MYDIRLQNLTKRYDDKLALDNVSLDIEQGEIFGLLGPNGAGKTTMIHILCGLTPMDRGDVHIGGTSIKDHPEKIKAQIGYVPQEIVLFDTLSVWDNMDYFGRLYGLRGSHLREKIDQSLEIAGLTDRKNQKVKKLSGGMQRRLNLVCAIMHDPKILVLDEPTVGVDPQSRNHILEAVRSMNKKNQMTVVYTSHYMEEVEALCDRLMILDLGRELVKGSKKEILRTVTQETIMVVRAEPIPKELVTSLKEIDGVKTLSFEEDTIRIVIQSSDDTVEEIIHHLLQQPMRIRNVTIDDPDLETVFLSITGKALRD